jgi:hypothetical protein
MKGERYMRAIKETQMVVKEKTYAVIFCAIGSLVFLAVLLL